VIENIDFLIADANQGDFLVDIYEANAVFATVRGGNTYTATGVTVGPGYAGAGAIADAKGPKPQVSTNTVAAVTDWLSYAAASANAQTKHSSSSSYSTGYANQGSVFVYNSNQTWR
jgi:hypothetical protein